VATPPPSRSVNTRMAASPLCKRPAAASTTTMWRLVDAPDRRHPLARYPVRACPCADRGVGGVGVWLRLDIDATSTIDHSESKEEAARDLEEDLRPPPAAGVPRSPRDRRRRGVGRPSPRPDGATSPRGRARAPPGSPWPTS
jgi:hypothetical protein